jgi:hypothetical protein
MKREVERKKKLPAFSFGIGELEILWGRLLALFDSSETVHCNIEIKLPSENLKFESIEELKRYTQLRGRITKFSLWLSQGGRRVLITSSYSFGFPPEVSATAETERWCAGAIETVFSFVQSNRLWYHWFVSVPFGVIFYLFLFIPFTALMFLPKGQSLDKTLLTGWIGIVITLGILYFAKTILLPSSVLRVTQEEGFIRRYAAELSLIIAIITAILTVIGWFFEK